MSIAISACSSSSKRQSEPLFLNASHIDSADIQNAFCINGKQSKPLMVNFIFIVPQIKKGKPIDISTKDTKYFSDKKIKLFRDLFYLASSEENSFVKVVDESKSEVVDYAKRIDSSIWLSHDQVYTNVRIIPLFIDTTDGNKIVFFEKIITTATDQSAGYQSDRVSGNALTKRESKAIVELNALVNSYTILEPTSFQKQSYKIESNSTNSNRCDVNDLIAVDGDGKVQISAALECQDKIWKRYIQKFTRIKESTTRDPQILNVELSLDLNPFCQYGRKISDLQSQ